MADTGSDFLTFLKANYPEDYNKLSTDNVADSLINAVISKHKSHFELWKKVPERIRDEYLGKVPHDIIEAAKTDNNLTLAECREIEAERHDISSIPSPASIYDNPIIKGIVLSEVAKNRIAEKTHHMCNNGCSHKNAVILAMTNEMQKELLKKFDSGEITKTEKNVAWQETRYTQQKSLKEEYFDNQPERGFINILKNVNRGKIDKETATPKLEILMVAIKSFGREKELEEYLKKPESGFNKFNEDTLELFNTIKENTVADPSFDIKKMHEIIGLNDSKKTLKSKEFTVAWKQIRGEQHKTIKQEYIDNQPEKMLIHIAKQLNRGKIDKETALPQMDVLMKKVKDMGREQQLSEYLKQPQSGYNKLNEDNKVLFNELMLSYEVGAVAQNLNKVRNMTTKDTPVTEAKTTYVPTSDKVFNQTKIINSKIAQER